MNFVHWVPIHNFRAFQGIQKIVPVSLTDGAYYSFPDYQKIEGEYILTRKKNTLTKKPQNHGEATSQVCFEGRSLKAGAWSLQYFDRN